MDVGELMAAIGVELVEVGIGIASEGALLELIIEIVGEAIIGASGMAIVPGFRSEDSAVEVESEAESDLLGPLDVSFSGPEVLRLWEMGMVVDVSDVLFPGPEMLLLWEVGEGAGKGVVLDIDALDAFVDVLDMLVDELDVLDELDTLDGLDALDT